MVPSSVRVSGESPLILASTFKCWRVFLLWTCFCGVASGSIKWSIIHVWLPDDDVSSSRIFIYNNTPINTSSWAGDLASNSFVAASSLYPCVDTWYLWEWFSPSFLFLFCLIRFRFGAWFSLYVLSFLATRFPAFLLFWRGEVMSWPLGVFWLPRVRRLVDSDLPALHTGGLSYHSRLPFKFWKSFFLLKTLLLRFLFYLKTSPFNLISFFLKSFPAISDLIV